MLRTKTRIKDKDAGYIDKKTETERPERLRDNVKDKTRFKDEYAGYIDK